MPDVHDGEVLEKRHNCCCDGVRDGRGRTGPAQKSPRVVAASTTTTAPAAAAAAAAAAVLQAAEGRTANDSSSYY